MPEQLNFLQVFEAAAFEVKTAHLPAALGQAVPYFRDLIKRHHTAMMEGDFRLVKAFNAEAHDLAVKLNNGDPGILADDDSPGNILERETAATPGEVPMWGQKGEFVIEVNGMKAQIDLEGIFGLACDPIPGFSALAVDYDKPFISETGYRSFLGYHSEIPLGVTPDVFAAKVIADHMKELKGKLRRIEERYLRPA